MGIVLQRVIRRPNLYRKGDLTDSQERAAQYLLNSNCIPQAWRWKREDNNKQIHSEKQQFPPS